MAWSASRVKHLSTCFIFKHINNAKITDGKDGFFINKKHGGTNITKEKNLWYVQN